MNEWPRVTLGEIAAPIRNALVGGPFGSNLTTRDFVTSGVPIIQGRNMGGRWLAGDFVYVSPEKASTLAANLARPRDVIFTQRGTVGQVSLVPDNEHDAYIVSQSQMKLTVDAFLADPLFVYYVFTTTEQKEYMLRHAIRTGVPHTNLGILRAASMNLPPLGAQRAITDTLGALDDKIELNSMIARDLDRTARIELEVCLTRGSRATNVGSVARFHNNQRRPLSAMERARMPGDYPYFGATGAFDRVGEYIFDDILVLVGEDGSVVQPDGSPVVQYVWGRCWVNNHAHVLTGDGITTELLSVALARADVRPYVTGAVQPKLSMRNLKAVGLEIPRETDLAELEQTLAALFARRRAAENESRALVALREVLLPALVSGRLRVSEAHERIEAPI